MENYEDMQNLWQDAEAATVGKKGKISPSLLDALRAHEQKGKREFRWTNIAMIFTTVVLTAMLFWMSDVFSIIGFSLIITAMAIFLGFYRKTQLQLKGAGHELSNRDFAHENIDKLETLRHVSSQIMPLYASLLIAGLNVVYISALAKMAMPARIGVHFIMTLGLAVLFYFGIKKALKKFDAKVQPMIDELKKVME